MSLKQIIAEYGIETKLNDIKSLESLTHLKFTWGKHGK